jgi:hypothetical protein
MMVNAPVATSQIPHCIGKTDNAVYIDNHTKSLRRQNAGFFNGSACGSCSNNYAKEGLKHLCGFITLHSGVLFTKY